MGEIGVVHVCQVVAGGGELARVGVDDIAQKVNAVGDQIAGGAALSQAKCTTPWLLAPAFSGYTT
jgi:hypothetical protein